MWHVNSKNSLSYKTRLGHSGGRLEGGHQPSEVITTKEAVERVSAQF